MMEITLSKGLSAIVDDEQYEWLSRFKWHAVWPTPGREYAYARRWEYCNGKQKPVLMHREVIAAAKGEIVDHINRNRLDNRRENLRLCNGSQNQANKESQNSLGYRGVQKHKNLYRAACNYQRKLHRSKSFPSAKEAAVAYDDLAKSLYGDFAILNFPVSA